MPVITIHFKLLSLCCFTGVSIREVEGDLEGQFLEGAEQKTPGSKGSRTGYGFPHQDSDVSEISDGRQKDTDDTIQSSTVTSPSSPPVSRPGLINFVKGSS